MNIINKSSLSATLDNLNAVFFEGKKLNTSEKKEVAGWISSRQGLEGSYRNMFAPTEKDYRGIQLFTGEKLTSIASIGHILGEESMRALYLLGIESKETIRAIETAKRGLQKGIELSYLRGYDSEGTYCCGKCTAAYWRNISAEDNSSNESILNAGLKYLKSQRDGKGKWKKFPFYYTLLSLSGIDFPAVKAELEYIAPVLERASKRSSGNGKYEIRRKKLVERVLGSL